MEYYSNFIWEKDNSGCCRVSLVLQHVIVRKKSVALACVCESENAGEAGVTESGYFTEGLVEWFHKHFLKKCEGKMSEAEVEKLLQTEVRRLLKEEEGFLKKRKLQGQLHYWGILLWESQFCLFCRGTCEGYLINKRFGKKNIRRLGGELQQEQWFSGRLQRNLGLLLCTAGFMETLEKEEAAEVLNFDGEASDDRLEKRLRELWRENSSRGGKRIAGAIYLHT